MGGQLSTEQKRPQIDAPLSTSTLEQRQTFYLRFLCRPTSHTSALREKVFRFLEGLENLDGIAPDRNDVGDVLFSAGGDYTCSGIPTQQRRKGRDCNFFERNHTARSNQPFVVTTDQQPPRRIPFLANKVLFDGQVLDCSADGHSEGRGDLQRQLAQWTTHLVLFFGYAAALSLIGGDRRERGSGCLEHDQSSSPCLFRPSIGGNNMFLLFGRLLQKGRKRCADECSRIQDFILSGSSCLPADDLPDAKDTHFDEKPTCPHQYPATRTRSSSRTRRAAAASRTPTTVCSTTALVEEDEEESTGDEFSDSTESCSSACPEQDVSAAVTDSGRGKTKSCTSRRESTVTFCDGKETHSRVLPVELFLHVLQFLGSRMEVVTPADVNREVRGLIASSARDQSARAQGAELLGGAGARLRPSFPIAKAGNKDKQDDDAHQKSFRARATRHEITFSSFVPFDSTTNVAVRAYAPCKSAAVAAFLRNMLRSENVALSGVLSHALHEAGLDERLVEGIESQMSFFALHLLYNGFLLESNFVKRYLMNKSGSMLCEIALAFLGELRRRNEAVQKELRARAAIDARLCQRTGETLRERHWAGTSSGSAAHDVESNGAAGTTSVKSCTANPPGRVIRERRRNYYVLQGLDVTPAEAFHNSEQYNLVPGVEDGVNLKLRNDSKVDDVDTATSSIRCQRNIKPPAQHARFPLGSQHHDGSVRLRDTARHQVELVLSCGNGGGTSIGRNGVETGASLRKNLPVNTASELLHADLLVDRDLRLLAIDQSIAETQRRAVDTIERFLFQIRFLEDMVRAFATCCGSRSSADEGPRAIILVRDVVELLRGAKQNRDFSSKGTKLELWQLGCRRSNFSFSGAGARTSTTMRVQSDEQEHVDEEDLHAGDVFHDALDFDGNDFAAGARKASSAAFPFEQRVNQVRRGADCSSVLRALENRGMTARQRFRTASSKTRIVPVELQTVASKDAGGAGAQTQPRPSGKGSTSAAAIASEMLFFELPTSLSLADLRIVLDCLVKTRRAGSTPFPTTPSTEVRYGFRLETATRAHQRQQRSRRCQSAGGVHDEAQASVARDDDDRFQVGGATATAEDMDMVRMRVAGAVRRYRRKPYQIQGAHARSCVVKMWRALILRDEAAATDHLKSGVFRQDAEGRISLGSIFCPGGRSAGGSEDASTRGEQTSDMIPKNELHWLVYRPMSCCW